MMSVKWMKPVNIGIGFVGAREHATKALEQSHLRHENRIPGREAAANAQRLDDQPTPALHGERSAQAPHWQGTPP